MLPIVATTLFIWDIYKWWTSGPRLKMRATPNTKRFGAPIKDNNTYIHVTVSNVGDRKTTITNLAFKYYKTFWNKIVNKPDLCAIIPSPAPTQPIPHIVDAGEEWRGKIDQNANTGDGEIEDMLRDGYFICEVDYSDRQKPVRKRVRISSNKTKSN